MKQRAFAAAAVLFGVLLTGCATYGGGMMVRTAPPPPRYAVIGRAPGPGYVWTDGYWNWGGGRWYWVGGRWMRPPRPHAMWVPGRWVETRHGQWRFQRGRWRQ